MSKSQQSAFSKVFRSRGKRHFAHHESANRLPVICNGRFWRRLLMPLTARFAALYVHQLNMLPQADKATSRIQSPGQGPKESTATFSTLGLLIPRGHQLDAFTGGSRISSECAGRCATGASASDAQRSGEEARRRCIFIIPENAALTAATASVSRAASARLRCFKRCCAHVITGLLTTQRASE